VLAGEPRELRRGVRGEFKWSSQHLDQAVCGWGGQERGRQQRREGLRCCRRAARRQRGASIGNASGRRSPGFQRGRRVVAGVSPAVGTRWFREGGGMRSVSYEPLSGRYLWFAEREELRSCAPKGAVCGRSRGASAVRRRRFHGSCTLVVWHGISVTYSTGGSGSEGAIGVIVAGDPLE
jgi:hypothetical protein